MDTFIGDREPVSVADRYEDCFRRLGRRVPSSRLERVRALWLRAGPHDNFEEAQREMEAYRRQARRAVGPEGWSLAEPAWQRAYDASESLRYRRELEHAADDKARRAPLYWMAAQGKAVELDFLGRYRDAYQSQLSPESLRLIERAEQEIRERHMAAAEQQYERNREQWEALYAHQYIAIADGDVIDADYSFDNLIERLESRASQERGLFPYVRRVDTHTAAPPAAPPTPEPAPFFVASHTLRAGHDWHLPAEAAVAEAEAIKTTSPDDLGTLVEGLRYMLGYFPLTIIVDGWEHAAARSFWQAAQPLREARDKAWLLGRGAAAVSDAVYLDVDEPADRSLARALVADLLFVAAADSAELEVRLARWPQHALAVIVAAPDADVLQRYDAVGLPHLRFTWQAE